MLFRSCTGNLNKNMRHLEFFWIGGAGIILTVHVISDSVYLKRVQIRTGGTKTSYPAKYRQYGIYPSIGGEVYFSSTSFFSNPNGWNDSLRLNFYNYPALIAPMSWIDSVRPSLPVIKSHNSNDSLIFQFERGGITDTLKGFAVYKAEGAFNIDSSRVFRFIPYSPSSGTGFLLNDLIKDLQGRYFVTAISKTNNESDPIMIYPLSGQRILP